MSKLEITIKYAEDLIAALTRLAEALENKQSAVQVTVDESGEVNDPSIAPEQPEEIKKPETVEKSVTLEQVRAVLTAKSQAGKKAAIQELFKKYGATKLTSVDPAKFTDLLKEAEEL